LKRKYKNLEFQLLGFLDVQNPSAISQKQMESWEKEGIIHYLGSTDDVRNIIAGVDCVVLPSFYREGIPRSLLEAASMAKPIITTNNVGCNEVVDDEINGFLCKPMDTQDLIMKMEKMIFISKEDRIRMGEKGREKILKEFNEHIVIRKYVQSIENITN
jgi:glycosyltransferase involved in cell wall biosynthesis